MRMCEEFQQDTVFHFSGDRIKLVSGDGRFRICHSFRTSACDGLRPRENPCPILRREHHLWKRPAQPMRVWLLERGIP